MKASFIGKRIAVFIAHPDDEGLAAGTMCKNHREGGKTFLVCATYGEKGKSHLAKPVSDAALKRIRRSELLAAAKVLGVDKVVFLGLPDTGVRGERKKLYEKGLAAIRRIAPGQILSFGPEGISGHWDHIAVGRAARKIAKELKVPLAAFTFARAASARPKGRHFLRRRKFGRYAGVPEHRLPDLEVKVDPKVKFRALRNHRSQFGDRGPFSGFPKRVREKLFHYEHFVQEKL